MVLFIIAIEINIYLNFVKKSIYESIYLKNISKKLYKIKKFVINK